MKSPNCFASVLKKCRITFFVLFDIILSSSLSDWNFNGLEQSSYFETTYQSFTYHFNFRKAVQPDSLCTVSNCVFFERLSNINCECFGTLNTENVVIFPDESGINFTYSFDGSYAHITLKCADSLSYSAYYSGSWDDYAEIRAPQGCKGYGMNKTGKRKNKLGWGFAFCLIIFILIFMYFAAGIPISYYLFHKRGIEILPFILYIGSFFGLVGYGVKFLFVTISSKIRGEGGEVSYGKL